jgi:hypothetical protein
LSYLRQTPEQTILVALNFKNRSTSVDNTPHGNWKVLLSTNQEVQSTVALSTEPLQLAPYEVVILESV